MASSPRTWRLAFFATLSVGLAAIAVLAYHVVDQAVSLAYMSDGYARTEGDLKLLADAFPRDRYKKKDLVVVLRRLAPQGHVAETGCTVQLNGLRFEFDDRDRLIGINTKAQYSPEHVCRGS